MRNRFHSAFAYGAIIISTLIVLEFTFRIYDVISGRILFDSLLNYAAGRNDRSHPFLQYTASRNFQGLITHIEPNKKYLTTTNSHGFRTHEFYPKIPGRVRVLLLGDSFMFGYNASDDDTTQAVLEKLLRNQVSRDVEVFSLGVTSYSGVRYAALARIYFEYLRPDVVIVALDQTDFGEDVRRIDDYVLDSDGYPFILKVYKELEGDTKNPKEIFVTQDGKTIVRDVSKYMRWKILIRAGSSFVNELVELKRSLSAWEWSRANTKDPPTLTYTELREKFGSDLSKSPYERDIWWQNIPYDFATAVVKYQATYKSLEFIKKKSDEVGAKMYLSSYPYPWMVKLGQSLTYQLNEYKFQLDFRKDRVHPKVVEKFARDLGIGHLNSYPIFEKDEGKNWGDFDPHFNALGYRLYANFLFNSIKDEIGQLVTRAASSTPRAMSPRAQ